MRLLKTHSHTSERPGYEARKNAKKVIEGNADTIRKQTIRPNLPRTASVAGGGETARRYGKTNHRQNPPAYRRRGGGGDKRRKRTRNGKVVQPTVREGGRCLAENAYQKRKQNNVHHVENKSKHTVLCHCVSSEITLAAPRLGAEEGVGRTTKKTNPKNL